MAELKYVGLPLYEDPDYFYIFSLERVAYKIRFYYNERMKQWMMDLRYANNEPVVLGEALVPEFPVLGDYLTQLSGFFWLEPIGESKNETTSNPLELKKYYRLFYFWEE